MRGAGLPWGSVSCSKTTLLHNNYISVILVMENQAEVLHIFLVSASQLMLVCFIENRQTVLKCE